VQPFWQDRFGAVAMDEAHLATTVLDLVFDLVLARLVEQARDWRWSSVRAHLSGGRGSVPYATL
jgi:putative transposase